MNQREPNAVTPDELIARQRTDAELIKMYREGRQHDMTDDERKHLHDDLLAASEDEGIEEDSDNETEPPAVPPAVKSPSDDDAKIHQWPISVLRPPGLVGEVFDWILSTAPQPQPKFATAAALTVCGALIGRGVKDYTGQRTNLFTLCVVPSCGGKQHPFSCGQKLITALERKRLLTGEVTSDSALEILLDDFPVRLMFLDEVGDYLGSLKTAGQANPHLKTVVPRLKSLWSSASSVYIGKTRAPDTNGKWKPPRKLIEPHVSIYGTGAPSRLFESMTERDFDDGSVPRFIVFVSEEMPMRAEKPEAVVPADLRAKLNHALQCLGLKPHTTPAVEGVKPDYTPTARLVSEDIGAAEMFQAFEELKHEKMVEAADDPPLYLWGKAVENARRIALTVACFRNPESPMVELCDAQYAVTLLTNSVNEMIAYVRENVAATEKERDLKKVERIIRAAKWNGISKSDLTRRSQSMRSANRLDALADLKDGDIIVEIPKKGKGQKKVSWYWHSKYLK